jgi:hypothetical protein
MKNRLPLRTLELLQVFTFKVEVVSVGWFVVCNATFNNISVVSWSVIDVRGVNKNVSEEKHLFAINGSASSGFWC